VGHTRPGLAEASHLLFGQVDAMGEPDVAPEPAEVLQVLERPKPEALQAEHLLVLRLGEVGVQPDALLTRQPRDLGHQTARHREG
jgi:hypothetical protein